MFHECPHTRAWFSEVLSVKCTVLKEKVEELAETEKQIAAKLGNDPSTIHRRKKRLESEGKILVQQA